MGFKEDRLEECNFITLEDMEAVEVALTEAKAEIQSIKDQIEDHDSGERARPQGWRTRARFAQRKMEEALALKRAEAKTLRRKWESQRSIEKTKRAAIAADKAEADLKAAEIRTKKMMNIRKAEKDARIEKEIVLDWVRSNYPDRLQEVYDALQISRDSR